jgi:hypothetical protein
MGFEGELLVSTGSPPEFASILGVNAPECFKAWVFCECMVCSGALQCHVLMRARVGVHVGSHPRLAIHMRKKEASRCKVCAPANGCMLARVHGVQCVPSSYVRTVVVKYRSKNSRGKKVARDGRVVPCGWATEVVRIGGGVGRMCGSLCGLSEVSQLNGRGWAVIEGDCRFPHREPQRGKNSPSSHAG